MQDQQPGDRQSQARQITLFHSWRQNIPRPRLAKLAVVDQRVQIPRPKRQKITLTSGQNLEKEDMPESALKDPRLLENHGLKWTSLPQVIQQTARLLASVFKQAKSILFPNQTPLKSKLREIVENSSSLFNMEFKFTPGANSKLELTMFQVISELLGILLNLTNSLNQLNNLSDIQIRQKILLLLDALQSKNGKHIFQPSFMISVIEYLVVLTKSPTYQLQSSISLVNKTLLESNRMLNNIQKGAHKAEEHKRVIDMDDEVPMQIDTSTINQEPPPGNIHDDVNQRLQEALQEQNLIYTQNRNIINNFWPQTLNNILTEQHQLLQNRPDQAMNLLDKEKVTRLQQFNRWYWAKMKYNKYFHDLTPDQKIEYKVEHDEYSIEEIMDRFVDKDINAETLATSNRTMEDFYLDAVKYDMKDVKDLLEFVRCKVKTYVGFTMYNMTNSYKLQIRFKTPIQRQQFLNQWNQIKVTAPFLWRGVSRWRYKPICKPKDFKIIPRDKRGRGKKKVA